jgi:hypothetical protein
LAIVPVSKSNIPARRVFGEKGGAVKPFGAATPDARNRKCLLLDDAVHSGCARRVRALLERGLVSAAADVVHFDREERRGGGDG